MPFCTNCGAFTEIPGRFCTACGKAVSSALPAEANKLTASPAPIAKVPAAKPRRRHWFAAITLVFFLAALAMLGWFAVNGDMGGRWIPGWKVSRDVTGACEAASPADWQLGRDFFLEREPAESLKNRPERMPPHGMALWKINRSNPEYSPQTVPGKRFQIRTSIVRGGSVCSVWKIKDATNFTSDETSTMKRVGRTLRWLR